MNDFNILVISNNRADFGKMRIIIDTLKELDNLNFKIGVVGTHLLEEFGLTYKEVDRLYKDYLIKPSTVACGSGHKYFVDVINQLNEIFEIANPNLVIFHGDRIEAMATSIYCKIENLTTIHIEGGETSGCIDDQLRHACTCLSNYHFSCNEHAYNKINQLGIRDEFIFNIGSPELDFYANPTKSFEEFKERYNFPFDEYGICSFHPVNNSKIESIELSDLQYSLLREMGQFKFLVLGSNNDKYNQYLRKNITKIASLPNVIYFESISFEYFVTATLNCSIFFGNSSAGIREAAFAGIQTINIGTRQDNRSLSTSILNLDLDKEEIKNAIRDKWNFKYEKSISYGDGNSRKLIYSFFKNNVQNIKIGS